MTKEIWKPVPGFEKTHEVSNMGRVKTLDRYVKDGHDKRFVKGQVLKPWSKGNGYVSVTLYDTASGKRKSPSVHRLVAEVFCDRPEGCDYVDHLNSVRDDNRAENLQWVTQKTNVTRSLENRPQWMSSPLRPSGKCNQSNTGIQYISLDKDGIYRVRKEINGKVLCKEFKNLHDAVIFREGVICALERAL